MTDRGPATARCPGGLEQLPEPPAELGEISEGPVEICELAPHELEHVWTRAAAGPPHLDDVLDLVEPEPEPPGARHEGEHR